MGKKFDAIVIGAGLSGMGVGALLAKAGKKVLIVEKNKSIGGRATSFNYKGYILNIGEHAGLVGGRIDVLIEAAGKKPPERGTFDEMMIYSYEKHKMDNALTMAPADSSEMTKLVEEVTTMPTEELEKLDAVSAREWVKPRITDPLAEELIRTMGIVYNTIPNLEDMAASSLVYCFQKTLKSTLTFLAAYGIGSFSDTLAEVLKENGGVIKTGTRAAKILLDNNRVRGVELEPEGKNIDGMLAKVSIVEAPIVVSAIPIWNIFRLIPESTFPPEFVKSAKNMNKLTANVGFSAGLKEPLFTEKMFIMTDMPRLGYPATVFMTTNLVPPSAPKGKHLLESSSICPIEIGDDRDRLRKAVQAMKDDLNEMYPGWEKKAHWIRPYFHWEEPARTPGRDGVFKPGPRSTGINGLFLAGDSVNTRETPGMEAASESAMICAREILGKLP
ncbi:MAG: NAD(P)/FAD-dependent oxidoreductase [Deltaproteobacteria bacterium]|nr:MAG: NAD(P)/FAD-dependent oxidoreductase [Deltaproteobacteria bacterium]